ncbi:MAG: carbon-nitrogen hydrolase [Planctomycetes bacterium]|nr:carbon-nitrogen hydrolase [Planctomycetota bacterium]
MDLAIAQFEPCLGRADETAKRLEALLPVARGVDLLVLPELANSGYAFASRDQALESSEPADGAGPFQRFLREACRRYEIGAIATGLCERAGEKLYNSAVLLDERRGLFGLYRKLHLFDTEKLVFEPGDLGLPLFELRGAKLGLLICFDWFFPEVWRSLALDGADLIVHPSNLVLPGRCQRGVPVHAMINRLFIATANRIGTEGALRFTGESLIVDPRGEVLAKASAERPEVLRVSIDPTQAREKRVTARNDALGDRRPEHYSRLVR